MDFLLGERLAVDLLNTVILQDGRVRDLLGGAGDVAAWAEAAGVLPRGVVRVTSLGSEPAGLRAFREALRRGLVAWAAGARSEEHTSELQSQSNLVCRLLLEKKKNKVR